MMKRREFISLVGGAVATWPLTAHAQQRSSVPRIGYVFSFTQAEGEQLWQACRQGLRELGYVEGQNIILEPRWADGLYERLPNIVAELLRDQSGHHCYGSHASDPCGDGGDQDNTHRHRRCWRARKGRNCRKPRMSRRQCDRPEPLDFQIRVESAAIANGSRAQGFARCRPVKSRKSRQCRFLGGDATRVSTIGESSFRRSKPIAPIRLERAFVAAAGRRVDALTVFDDPALWSFRAQIVALAAARKLPRCMAWVTQCEALIEERVQKLAEATARMGNSAQATPSSEEDGDVSGPPRRVRLTA